MRALGSFILFTFAIALSANTAIAQNAPKEILHFRDYPVDSTEVMTGLSPKMKFSYQLPTGQQIKPERKRLRPNFAGHYIVYVDADCGTGCIGITIKNAKDGREFDVPFSIENCCGPNGWLPNSEPRVEFELRSKLLIIRGSRNEHGWGTYYYAFENDKLKLIRAIKGKIIKANRFEKSTRF